MKVCLHTLLLKIMKLLLVFLCEKQLWKKERKQEICYCWKCSLTLSVKQKHFLHIKHLNVRKWQQCGCTWSVGILLLPLSTHAEEGVDMAEEDEWGWEDRLLMVGHNEVVTLVLPHQIRNGLHLQIHIAGKQRAQKWRWGQCWWCCGEWVTAVFWERGWIRWSTWHLLEEGDEEVDH